MNSENVLEGNLKELTVHKLEDLLEITSSKRIHMADYVKDGIPFYRGKEVIERAKGNSISTELFITHEQFQLIEKKFGAPIDGDILLTSVGTLGVPYFVNGDGPFYFKDGNVTWLRNFRHSVRSKFIYYWLLSPAIQQKLDEVSIGSTQKALTISALKSLQLELPPLKVQDYIIDILDAVSGRIALLRETNATLEAIAHALFKAWFVDFEPVQANAGTQAPSLPPEIQALFPDTFTDSPQGPIPAGWDIGKVEDLMELAYGKALKATDRADGEVPVYGSGGITGSHNKALVNVPSIIVGRKGTVGSLYWEDRPFFPIDTVFYVKSDKPLSYCFYLLQTLGLHDMNTDGAVPGLNRNNVYRLSAAIPPNRIFHAFDETVAVIRATIFNNNQQAHSLASLRDTLLPRLISGNLDFLTSEVVNMDEV